MHIFDTLDFTLLTERIVNSLLFDIGFIRLDYKIIVLTLIDTQSNLLKRVALSTTQEASITQEVTPVPFEKIEIPLNASNNLLIKAIKTNKTQHTTYWPDIFKPALSNKEAIRNQKSSGIKTSMIYPITIKKKPIGALILSMKKNYTEVTEEEKKVIVAFANIVGLAVQNSKLFSSTKNLASKLEIANNKLKLLDQMKDDFISIASHELKTPLSVAKNNLWMYKNAIERKLTEEELGFINGAEESLVRLQGIVNELLDISRIQQQRLTFDISECDLYKLLLEVIDSIDEMAEKQKIKIIPPKNQKAPSMTDNHRFKEIVENILSNSIKYAPNGEVKIELNKDLKRKEYKIKISDTGPGISEKDFPKIFTKFGRGTEGLKQSSVGSSTGLGLYIAKNYTEGLGGEIGFTSKVGKGTTFFFTIPFKYVEKKVKK